MQIMAYHRKTMWLLFLQVVFIIPLFVPGDNYFNGYG